MALAAMPTAVFVGMGLTPRLALADDKDFPYAPGPCVTRSDEPVTEEETPAPTGKPSTPATATPTAAPTTLAPASTGTPAPTATETGQAPVRQTGEGAKATAGTTVAPTVPSAPTVTPTPTASGNPLDPLGLGEALKDFFDGLAPKPTATTAAAPTASAPTPTASATAPAARPATPDEAPPSATAPPATTTSGAPEATADPDPEAGKTKAAIEKAAEEAGVEVQELPEDAKGLDARKDESIPDGAKPRFPCPERDAAALAAAEVEPGIPLLPDEPWRLESTRLTLSGLKYHGIVEVKTGGGRIKKVLKFTASAVRIKDLHQLTEHSKGLTTHVRSDKGKESTITGSTVTMYTEELKGNLIGLIPVTFGPESPPPLNLPEVFFTDVKLKQAGQFGGTLRVPGLRNTIEPS
nr:MULTISPECIES: hypothetical protein [unclassified Streptomyces]